MLPSVREPTPGRVVLGRFHALSSVFCVDAPVGPVAGELARILAPLRQAYTSERSHTEYRIEGSGRWTLSDDDGPIATDIPLDRLVGWLFYDVNRRAVTDTTGSIRLHAAVAARPGEQTAVLLPGAMESGKSTLVAALVERSWGYLSDEVAAVDRSSRTLAPYPKPIGLDPGSWELLRHLDPRPGAEAPRIHDRQWQIPVPGPSPSSALHPLAIVLPRYLPGGGPAPRRLTSAEAFLTLASCCFDVDRFSWTMEALASIAGSIPVWSLAVDDLERACSWLEGAGPTGPRQVEPTALRG